jgi:hypothetical protein
MLLGAFLDLQVSGDINAGELLVGVGTILLAGITAWLAKRTGEEVDRGRENVDLAARALEMHDWPFLVATPDRPTFGLSPIFDRDTGEPVGDPEWRCDAILVNHGRGPAILDGASLRDIHGREFVDVHWKVESIYLPGEEPRLAGIGLGFNEPAPGGVLTLRLLYRSATGTRYETSHRLEVAPRQRAIRLDFQQTRLGRTGRA